MTKPLTRPVHEITRSAYGNVCLSLQEHNQAPPPLPADVPGLWKGGWIHGGGVVC